MVLDGELCLETSPYHAGGGEMYPDNIILPLFVYIKLYFIIVELTNDLFDFLENFTWDGPRCRK